MIYIIEGGAWPAYLEPVYTLNHLAMNPISTPVIYDLEEKAIRDVLTRHFVGSLAFIAHGDPHVLPITYFFDEANNSLISYSNDGMKISAMRENPSVSLGVYETQTPVNWKSVLVHGVFEELEQIDAKAHLKRFSEGVSQLMAARGIHQDAHIPDFSSKTSGARAPLVYRIRIVDWSGKYRSDKP